MLKRFNLPQLLLDLKRLNLRRSQFGGVNDTFEYIGPYLKKKRIGRSGFFYEFDRDGIFATGSQPDLHLSIIDATGFAVAHMTFKPDGDHGPAYHYGIKRASDNFEGAWITNHHLTRYPPPTERSILDNLQYVYDTIKTKVLVNRRDLYGNLMREPYIFPPMGTVGRAETTPQRMFAEDLKKRRRSLGLSDITNKTKRRITL